MQNPLAVVLALTLPLQVAQPPAPDQAQGSHAIIVNLSTSREKCNLDLASKIGLADLIGEREEWLGKCVAVDGYWFRRALFVTRRDALRRFSGSGEALSNRRVGIYGSEELLSSSPREPLLYTAIGIVEDCEKLWQQAIMVMGYCHYTDGPYIATAEMRRR